MSTAAPTRRFPRLVSEDQLIRGNINEASTSDIEREVHWLLEAAMFGDQPNLGPAIDMRQEIVWRRRGLPPPPAPDVEVPLPVPGSLNLTSFSNGALSRAVERLERMRDSRGVQTVQFEQLRRAHEETERLLNPPMSREREEELLAMTPLGQAVIKERREQEQAAKFSRPARFDPRMRELLEMTPLGQAAIKFHEQGGRK
jgi:hypothetical protein